MGTTKNCQSFLRCHKDFFPRIKSPLFWKKNLICHFMGPFLQGAKMRGNFLGGFPHFFPRKGWEGKIWLGRRGISLSEAPSLIDALSRPFSQKLFFEAKKRGEIVKKTFFKNEVANRIDFWRKKCCETRKKADTSVEKKDSFFPFLRNFFAGSQVSDEIFISFSASPGSRLKRWNRFFGHFQMW